MQPRASRRGGAAAARPAAPRTRRSPPRPLPLLALLAAASLFAAAATPRAAAAAAFNQPSFAWRAVRSALRTQVPPHWARGPLTLVTAYFDFGTRSKHSTSQYDTWLQNFLPTASAPMVCFTTEPSLAYLRELRGAHPTVYVLYGSIWDVPPAGYYRDAFEAQRELDPERQMHFAELYAMWSSKVWFTAAAAAHNPYDSEYFVWIDAGVFRSHSFPDWPSLERVRAALGACGRDDCVLASDVSGSGPGSKPGDGWGDRWALDLARHELFPGRDRESTLKDSLQGAVYAGRAAGMLWWAHEYYALMHDLLASGLYASKEQNLFDILMVRNYWRVVMLPARRLQPKCFTVSYFAFQGALSQGGCALMLERYEGAVVLNRTQLALPAS
ncbi:hypothetical protein Rsub_11146 [Raphidocelis subcapitata]|uniref:Uncharacterized protein n=1 Tax=Raphidocelis subcapitata TaxID=307507 RepID=A0A2V0PLW7_9CHLO|nr:hypothetical protein Rsub_11146 [Raphidocelis subcapitata]|eukprot:GBF98035.1 hypothetical protein Rsub_11146 [Raphidocelis subcapitata]